MWGKLKGKIGELRSIIDLQRGEMLFFRGYEAALFFICLLYERLKLRLPDSCKVVFRPVQLENAQMQCRPGRKDVNVLKEVLLKKYHVCPDVKDPNVVLDLGANVGFTTAHYACLYPLAKIVAVEADMENHQAAISNTKSWKDRVSIERAAIWSHDGVVSLSGADEVSQKKLLVRH